MGKTLLYVQLHHQVVHNAGGWRFVQPVIPLVLPTISTPPPPHLSCCNAAVRRPRTPPKGQPHTHTHTHTHKDKQLFEPHLFLLSMSAVWYRSVEWYAVTPILVEPVQIKPPLLLGLFIWCPSLQTQPPLTMGEEGW